MIEVPETAKRITDKNGREGYLQGVGRNEHNPNEFMAYIRYIDTGEVIYLPYKRIEKYL